MQIHTSDPMTVVSVKLNATLNTLSEVVGTLPQQLYNECEAKKIDPAGPMVFVYRGMDGDPDSFFELEVTLPIELREGATPAFSENYQINTLASFDYVGRTYIGPMDSMGKDGYEPLFVDMAKSGVQSSNEAREVYVNWAGPDSSDNRTDIQVGVIR